MIVAAVLGALIALLVLGTAVYTVVAGLSGASGGGEIVVLLLAFVIAGIGALFSLGVAALLHPRFPNPAALRMASFCVLLVIATALTRSFRSSTGHGPDALAAVAWIIVSITVISILVLLSRPAVKAWAAAIADRSRQQGYLPRNERARRR